MKTTERTEITEGFIDSGNLSPRSRWTSIAQPITIAVSGSLSLFGE